MCEEITPSTSNKIVVCCIHLENQSIILISAYRPPNNNFEYLDTLCSTISSIILANSNNIIWLGGDLNLPNIDWTFYSISGHSYPLQLCERFIDTLLDHSLSQLVNFPTRKENTMDIFAMNWPSLVTKCIPIPGISDHEAILLVSDMAAKIQPFVLRKIFLWRKANLDHIKEKIRQFSDDFLLCYTTVSTLWNHFKPLCNICISLIPSKSISTNSNHPWIYIHIHKATVKA